MRTCQSCGKENPPDQDFCECGEYLRWEPTGYVQAITPEMAAQAAAEAAAPAEDPAAAAPPPAAPAQPEPVVTQRPAPEPAAPAQPGNGQGNGNGSGLTTGDPLGGSATAPP